MERPLVLTVAGSDPTGGAGLELDLAVVTHLGGLGMACATALTTQDTTGVHGVHPLSGPLIGERLGVLLDDLRPDAIKVGMLASAEQVAAVEKALARVPRDVPLVVDPVLVASSGRELLDEEGRTLLMRGLALGARVITPNLAEARCLSGGSRSASAEWTADALLAKGVRAVLVTGGDEGGGEVVDYLADGPRRRTWREARIPGASPHGTGCALSTAIAVLLAMGRSLEDAVDFATNFVREGIRNARAIGRRRHGRPRLQWDLRLDSKEK